MINQILLNDSVLLPPHRVSEPDPWVGHIPFALWIVEQTAPRLLVELGCHSGNSYFAFCQAVQANRLATQCYAVDTWQGDTLTGHYEEEVYQSVLGYNTSHYGEFSRLLRQTFDQAADHFSDGSIDLLHIDGLHTYDAVRHDFETWLPKLSARAVVLFHDVNVRELDFGVWRLWEELAAEHPHLCFDHSNGLGVLFVGKEQPECIRLLLKEWSIPGGRVRVRRFFERLGYSVVLELHNTRLLQTVAARDAYIVTLAQDAAARDAYNTTLAQELAARDAHIATLVQDVAELDKTVREIFASTSWRLSAPFRTIKTLFFMRK